MQDTTFDPSADRVFVTWHDHPVQELTGLRQPQAQTPIRRAPRLAVAVG